MMEHSLERSLTQLNHSYWKITIFQLTQAMQSSNWLMKIIHNFIGIDKQCGFNIRSCLYILKFFFTIALHNCKMWSVRELFKNL